MSLTEFFQALIAPLVRGGIGWFENVVSPSSDGGEVITNLELRMLLATVLRIGVMTAGIYYGFSGMFTNLEVTASAWIAVVLDFFFSKLGKLAKAIAKAKA